jgi:pimeloyl-ACP methyl ester carboxylesterase
MGSANAQRFAIDHPARTRGLVLVAAFAGYRENPVLVEFCGSVAALTDPIDASFARDFQQSTLARPVPPAFFEMVVQESLKLPARVWRTLFTTFLDDDFAAGRHRIAAPTLIVWGTRDAFCPRGDQVVLSSEIAGSRLVVYEGAGHAVHWEEPERFASDLMAFASGLRA